MVIKRFCVVNCAAAPNLISSTPSRSEPPEAAETGVTVKLVSVSFNESDKVKAATKLFALFAEVPFVNRYDTVTTAPSGKALPTIPLPK